MGAATGQEAFLDLVYDAAVDASLWPVMLARFVELVGGPGGAMRSYYVPTEVGAVRAVGLDSAALDSNFRRFANLNPLKSSPEELRRRTLGMTPTGYRPGMKMDVEWLPKGDFVRTEYYNDFYRRFDIHSDISIGLTAGGGHWTGIDIYRSERQGPFTADHLALCAAVHPHLVRAFNLSRKLADVQGAGEGFAAVFNRSPHGLFLLDRGGKVRQINDAGHRLLGQAKGLSLTDGRLACRSPDATRRLRGLIDRAASADGQQRTGGAMGVSSPGALRPLSVTVAPLREQQAWPLHGGPAVMVCVTDLEAGVHLPEVLLRELFGLTPTETRVATALFSGLEAGEAARRLGVGLATVRTHLAHIYAKTGTTGQSDLARLLSRLATA